MIYFNINSPVHVLVGKHCGMEELVDSRIEEVHDKRNATICRKAFALTSTCEGARENIDNR